MATALYHQTTNELLTHFNPHNLTRFLNVQNAKDVVWNSALCVGAAVPGYIAASFVNWGLHKVNFLERFPLLNWVSEVAIKCMAFASGVAVNFWIVRNVLPAPVSFSADKAVRIYALVVICTFVMTHVQTQLPTLNKYLTQYIPLPIGGIVGCFPSSSLFVLGGLGALNGALAPYTPQA